MQRAVLSPMLFMVAITLLPGMAWAETDAQDAQRREAINKLEGGERWTRSEAALELALATAHDSSVVIVTEQGDRASGVNISPDGKIITALHNVAACGRQVVLVRFRDGSIYKGRLTRLSKRDNIALISLTDAEQSLPYAELAPRAPARGELVAAIGSPNGAAAPYWVSLGRYHGEQGSQAAYDAWTYWGHGGAPVVNANGQLIAMHTAWDPETKLRLGVNRDHLEGFLAAVGVSAAKSVEAAPPEEPRLQPASVYVRSEHDAILKAAINELERDIVWTGREAQVLESLRAVHASVVRIGGGTGVVVSPDGMVLTAYHVVDSYSGAVPIRFSNGQSINAKIVASSKLQDLALLKLPTPTKTAYPYAPIARSEPGVGSEVVIIGHPGSKSGREAWHASTGKILWYGDMVGIRGDLAYNAWTYWGHSGSPVFDTNGAIIGIHNSWNDRNGWRHGLRLGTIQGFLRDAGAL